MLSAQQFRSAAKGFCAASAESSNSTSHSWEWVDSTSSFAASLGGGYLCMNRVPVVLAASPGATDQGHYSNFMSSLPQASSSRHDFDKGAGAEESSMTGAPQQQPGALEEDTHADAECTVASGQTVCFYDYHIVYLPSYSVPVLLMKGYSAEGNILGWTDIVAGLPEAYQGNAKHPDAQWTFLANTEHPHLKTPWYMLHPCQTAELMSLMLEADASNKGAGGSNLIAGNDLQYFQAWFSLIASVIHMRCGPLT